MTIYSNGFVYKIYSDINEQYYIGSTIRTLEVRLRRHKVELKLMVNTKRLLAIWAMNIGFNNMKIIELCNYKNITRQYLLKYENEEIDCEICGCSCSKRNISTHKKSHSCIYAKSIKEFIGH